MDKVKNYFGIDVSKSTFDVYNPDKGHLQFENNTKGFKQFLKVLSSDNHCIMEATGYYHHLLSVFLFDNTIKVSVENPLKIKRFIQSKLTKIKTDKADAKFIYEYALKNDLFDFQPPNMEIRQLLSLLDMYQKQSTQLKNKIHGEQALGVPSKLVLKSLKISLKNLKKEIYLLEDKLEEIIKEEQGDLLARLQTIPSLGRKTALFLIVITDGFKNFGTASQLCSFTGLTPVIRQSGTSVRGKERISKIGNAKLRNLLFMCSFNACKCNRACRELYERIVAKGKSKKLALIAVCNKLIKQAFAIAKFGLCYDENFVSKLN
ncbi:MAG: IS110 family transposase [Tenacibaculum sp.]|nr:IS110 family transposase [Tenacibaculum sp.]